MKVIFLRMHQLRKLRELKLERGIFNSEALLLILNRQYTKSQKMVFKFLDSQDDDKVIARKMYTVGMLNSCEEYKNIAELVIPEFTVVVDDRIVDFAMEMIESHKNLGKILNDSDVSLSLKIPYLVGIGDIIDKVLKVDSENVKMQFGDLNEFNFILDEDGNIKVVDLDSAYVGQDEPINPAYYLRKNLYLPYIKDKYRLSQRGELIPNDNTDLFCYNMMILSILAKEDLFNKDMDTFYAYLYHMSDVGVDKCLLDSFTRLYTPADNINPKDMLNGIKPELEKDLDYKVFSKEYKRKV